MLSIARRIENAIDWSKMVSARGNTQERERYYISVIQNVLRDMGCSFETASSQQAVDIRNVILPDGSVTDFEAKSSNTNIFPLNDTLLKPDVYYILLYNKQHKETIG